MREAQGIFAKFTQEQVDKTLMRLRWLLIRLAIPLACMAVEETGRGVRGQGAIKNHYAAEYIYNAYKEHKRHAELSSDEA